MKLLQNWLTFLTAVFISILSTTLSAAPGVLVPFYIYPTTAAIQPLITAKTQHRSVPMRVVLNPNSGVGLSPNQDYSNAVTALRKAGIEVLGYVNTDYNSRQISDVMLEILTWKLWYSPDGIFLDALGASKEYYGDIKTYINTLGMKIIVGNAGQNVDPNYGSLVNSVVISNNDGLPDLKQYCNWNSTAIDDSLPAILVYDVPTLPSDFIQQADDFIGWIYVTSGTGENPWGTLPSYFSNLVGLLDKTAVNRFGTIVPFYVYPTTAAIQPLLTAKAANPIVPMIVILNPNSGPGVAVDQNYLKAVQALKAAGIVVTGYVHTSYGQRNLNDVRNEILQWNTWYQPDGIFFDEMSLNHPYYQGITAYTKSLGMAYTIGNPGTNIDVSAKNDVDILIVFENSILPKLTSYQNWAAGPKSKIGFLSYNIAQYPQGAVAQQSQIFGWMYITPDGGNGTNPWDSLPNYFPAMMQDLSKLNAAQ